MSLVYARTVAIHRAVVDTSVGAGSYEGPTEANETVVLSNLPASIQQQRHIKVPDANLPSDAYNKAGFNVFLPKRAAKKGSIVERDIVVDDLGNRYQITGAYWNILGYNLTAELLQA